MIESPPTSLKPGPDGIIPLIHESLIDLKSAAYLAVKCRQVINFLAQVLAQLSVCTCPRLPCEPYPSPAIKLHPTIAHKADSLWAIIISLFLVIQHALFCNLLGHFSDKTYRDLLGNSRLTVDIKKTNALTFSLLWRFLLYLIMSEIADVSSHI